MRYVLNKTYGINNINEISLKKIIEIFSIPNEIKLEESDDKINISIILIYSELEIHYSLHFFVENLNKPEVQYLHFWLKELYLSNKEKIKVGDEVKKILPKIKKYLKRNKKELCFKYEEDDYSGSYYFDNDNLVIYFEKYKNQKIVDDILITLPYEDILFDEERMAEIENIMDLKNKIENLFFN